MNISDNIGVPLNTFTLPTPTDITLTPFWTTIRQDECFIIQKSQTAVLVYKSLQRKPKRRLKLLGSGYSKT
ncbi:unnamed protein product [Absidia cylindrospora]